MTEPLPSASEPVEQLRDAIESENSAAVDACLEALEPVESARAVSRLSEREQVTLLDMLNAEEAAELVETLPEPTAAQLLENLEPSRAAAIITELPSDEQADVMGRLPETDQQAILAAMEPEDAAQARQLMQHPPDSAGGLMIRELLAYASSDAVDDVLRDLRANAEQYQRYDVQYAYVTDERDRLVGVLRLRDLLLASPQRRLIDFMLRDPRSVSVDANLEELQQFFDRHSLFGVPVVDHEGCLVGVVRQQDVEEAAEERSSRNLLKFTGILGGEELRTMPVHLRCVRRLSWLTVNILLNVVAASIIAWNQDTLSAVIALAVFLPIISDMSGCSGNQAVAVSMRELTLGMVEPSEVIRVLAKESIVGVINGLVLGLLLGLVAFLWKGNAMLGLVVGTALALNTLVAACLGGAVPLVLRRLKQDPALASGPILTTITDMSGFFLVLTFARYALSYLT